MIEEELKLKLPTELVEHLSAVPEKVKSDPLATWKKLGPIKLAEVFKQSTSDNPLIFDNQEFGCSSQSYSFDIFG